MAHGNGSRNGKVAPAAFPPPVDSRKEFIKRGLDPEEELIEVGVAIVGGGTAGLACANRLLQLLGADPELMERLGEVPVAVIEKAKTSGGHNLSGAVMRPGPLEELFPDMTREQWREEGFAFGEVRKEAIYLLPSARTKVRIPPPPPQRNHGNEVISVSALARWPLKISAKYHQIGGSWIYPMKDFKSGEDLVSIGFVIDLDYADATTSAHDLLQQFKTHPLVRGILEGGERAAWGAKAIPAGGYWAMPKLSMPGAVLVGDAGGMVNLAALKGVHYAIKSGMLAAEAIYDALGRGCSSFEPYEQAVDESV